MGPLSLESMKRGRRYFWIRGAADSDRLLLALSRNDWPWAGPEPPGVV